MDCSIDDLFYYVQSLYGYQFELCYRIPAAQKSLTMMHITYHMNNDFADCFVDQGRDIEEDLDDFRYDDDDQDCGCVQTSIQYLPLPLGLGNH